MSQLKPYPAYVDSGSRWIGSVPEGWAAKRLRHIASFSNSSVDKKSYEDQQSILLCNYTDVYYNEFIRPGLRFMGATASTKEIEQFTLRCGDIIITKDSEDASDIGIPSLVTSDLTGVVCGYHLTLIRTSEEVSPRFLHRAIQAHPSKAHFNVESPGITRFGLGQDTIGDLPIVFPALSDQEKVTDWIDSQTSRIDALIEKKTRFIELLKENRQALITHAVTKGLNPDALMKDSGIEWLGPVPAHWITVQLGKVTTNRCDGPFGSGLKSEHYQEHGVRVIRLQNIGSAEFRDTDKAFIAVEHWVDWLSGGHEAIDGDLLIAGLGDENNPLGRACVTPPGLGKALVKADCYRFRLDADRVCPHFAALQLTATARAECGAMATGATRDRLNLGLASARRLALPNIREQKEIVAYIQRHMESLDGLSEMTGRSIQLLQERRSALITAAVTGKIDLRDGA